MEVQTFGPQLVYGVKSVVLQFNAMEQDGSIMPLAMKVKIRTETGCHLFPTTHTAEKGVFSHFQGENWLVIGKTKSR